MVDLAAAQRGRRVHNLVHDRLLHDVARHGHGRAPKLLLDARDHLLGLGRIDVGHHHPRALLRKQICRLCANALARARDNGRLVCEHAVGKVVGHVSLDLGETFSHVVEQWSSVGDGGYGRKHRLHRCLCQILIPVPHTSAGIGQIGLLPGGYTGREVYVFQNMS